MLTHHHHRRSIRLEGYDYSSEGGYFITIVTFRRECLFGAVINDEMCLNQYGQIVKDEWINTAKLRPKVELIEDEFVVMPNHVHGIIWLNLNDISHTGRGTGRGTARCDRCTPERSVGAVPLQCHLQYHQHQIDNSDKCLQILFQQLCGHIKLRLASVLICSGKLRESPCGSEIIMSTSLDHKGIMKRFQTIYYSTL